jgi:hypothetical protein
MNGLALYTQSVWIGAVFVCAMVVILLCLLMTALLELSGKRD